MSTTSLAAWLRARVVADALLNAWLTERRAPLYDFEANALAMAALASRSRTPITLAIPSGRARLPLLTAVHAALIRLPAFPTPFGPQHGSVALVTRSVVRRDELAQLDAAGVAVGPALRPARLRADGRVAPLPSGAARAQQLADLLLMVHPSAQWGMPSFPPTTVVVDGVDEPAEFVDQALAWAASANATPIVYADVARRNWRPGIGLYPCGWSAIAAQKGPTGESELTRLAVGRGHAAAISAGPQRDLALAGAVLAESRRYLPNLPPLLVDAAILWRRLDELVTPIALYDAACSRWHSPTLTERIEDMALIRASDFPDSWRTWAETCWASLKGNLLAATAALATGSPKGELLIEIVDSGLLAQKAVDLAVPSRVARDAIIRHLAIAGVPFPVTGELKVRSLADPEPWGAPPATMFLGPPTRALRHRIVAADVGTANVLCYEHEIHSLRSILTDLLNEPILEADVVAAVTPPALNLMNDLASSRPRVDVSVIETHRRNSVRESWQPLTRLAGAVDAAALSALADAVHNYEGSGIELPDVDEQRTGSGDTDFGAKSDVVIPLAVTAVGAASGPVAILVPIDAGVTRIVNGRTRRIAASEIAPGMLVSGLDGQTPFGRLRPLLVEQRGTVTNMLLSAWEHALDMALSKAGGASALARALRAAGASITATAVGGWSGDDRIGPADPGNVRRLGEYAEHPVVAGSATAIATVMRNLRILHQSIGRVLAAPHNVSADASADLEMLLGPDAMSLVNQVVVWRVVDVGPPTSGRTKQTFGLRSATTDAAERLSR